MQKIASRRQRTYGPTQPARRRKREKTDTIDGNGRKGCRTVGRWSDTRRHQDTSNEIQETKHRQRRTQPEKTQRDTARETRTEGCRLEKNRQQPTGTPNRKTRQPKNDDTQEGLPYRTENDTVGGHAAGRDIALHDLFHRPLELEQPCRLHHIHRYRSIGPQDPGGLDPGSSCGRRLHCLHGPHDTDGAPESVPIQRHAQVDCRICGLHGRHRGGDGFPTDADGVARRQWDQHPLADRDIGRCIRAGPHLVGGCSAGFRASEPHRPWPPRFWGSCWPLSTWLQPATSCPPSRHTR